MEAIISLVLNKARVFLFFMIFNLKNTLDKVTYLLDRNIYRSLNLLYPKSFRKNLLNLSLVNSPILNVVFNVYFNTLTYLSNIGLISFAKPLILKKINQIELYRNVSGLTNKNYKSYSNSLFNLKTLINFFKYALIGLVLSSSCIIFLVSLKSSGMLKFLVSWFCVFFFYYLLISGFVFFLKKYRFSKFTGAIQRFWKRSFIIF